MRMIRNYYPLLEGVGLTAHDMGPGAANGTLSANVIWLPKGVTIAASQSRITSAACAGFNTTVGSIEMLVKPSWNNICGAVHTLWDTVGVPDSPFFLYHHLDNLMYLMTAGTQRGSFSFPWVAGTLYHVVLNWGENKLYINKVMVYDFDDAGLGLNMVTIAIGDMMAGINKSFYGNIYYFIVRDVNLTPAEITEFYNFFVNQYS